MEQSLDSVKVAFSFTANYASNIYTWDQNFGPGGLLMKLKKPMQGLLNRSLWPM